MIYPGNNTHVTVSDLVGSKERGADVQQDHALYCRGEQAGGCRLREVGLLC